MSQHDRCCVLALDAAITVGKTPPPTNPRPITSHELSLVCDSSQGSRGSTQAHYSWQMQCHHHSPALPFIHGPLDTSQVMPLIVGFRCILILPAVALSDDTIYMYFYLFLQTQEMHDVVFRALWRSGLRSTPFHFTQVTLKV